MSYANRAIEALDELAEVTAQRDALLEACRAILAELPKPYPHPETDALSFSQVIKIAKAAIAKAEGREL